MPRLAEKRLKSSQSVKGTGTGGREATTTYVRLELRWVPRQELHEVTGALSKEGLVAVLELGGEVLTGEVVVEVDEHSHSLREEWVWRSQEGLDGQLEELKVRHEELAVHELDD